MQGNGSRVRGPLVADVAIAGAGVAGLACGAWLARAGLRVVVLERDACPGGRAASWRDETTGDTVDIGPHVLTSEHRNLLALLQLLGTDDQVVWQRQPLITLLDAGRQLRMRTARLPPPLHGLPLLPNALRRLSLADMLSHTRLAWHAARLDEAGTLALDGEDALGWLRRMGVRERAIDWFWRSGMLALLNAPLEQCSAAAVMRIFRLLLGRSGYCFGMPAGGLADLYAPGCIARIERAGGAVLTGTAVHALQVEQGAFCGFALAGGGAVAAPAGVLALPPQAVAALGGGVPEPLVRRARAFAPSPYVSTLLWFDRPLTRERFWARVWNRRDLNTDFYDLANIRPARAGGPALVAANAIDPQEDKAGWTDEAFIARTRREVEEFAPAAAQARLVHARVHRIPMAIPRPLPGSESLRPGVGTAVRWLWLAGDWTATAVPCSMESAARSGALAAEAVLARLGRPRRIALPPPDTTGVVKMLQRKDAGFPLPRE